MAAWSPSQRKPELLSSKSSWSTTGARRPPRNRFVVSAPVYASRLLGSRTLVSPQQETREFRRRRAQLCFSQTQTAAWIPVVWNAQRSNVRSSRIRLFSASGCGGQVNHSGKGGGSAIRIHPRSSDSTQRVHPVPQYCRIRHSTVSHRARFGCL